MKKISALLLSAAMLLCLVSCSAAGEKAGGDFAYMEIGGGDTGAAYDRYLQTVEDHAEQIPDNGFVENIFTSASENGISTISADVDTVSYSMFRKLVSDGVPAKSMAERHYYFHTEEMINYFKYDYSLPKENELFGVTATVADCPWNKSSKLLVLGMQTEKLPETKANNLVFLIDVSGSMDTESKLGLVKKSFMFLIDNLTQNDTVSIVTYAGDSRVVLDGCSGADHNKIKKAVNTLEAGGSTYGQAGLENAYKIAEKHYVSGGNNRIIIASDGDFNVGVSTADGMTEFIKQKRGVGINTSALWFGDGIDSYGVSIMESIANNGGGVYYYIDGLTEAEKVFGTDLCATLNTIASDVKLQLTFDGNFVDQYRLVGYENRIMNTEDFDDDTKDAAEVGAGHSVTVMYELKLKDGAADADKWINFAVRYKRVGDEKSTLNEYAIGSKNCTDTPSDDFKFACAVAQTSMILNKSQYVGDLTLRDVLTSVSDMELTGYRSEFRELLKKLAR